MKTDAARELLEKLATDDAFRDRFAADPYAVLDSLGIQVDPGTRQARTGGVELPSKADILANLDAMAQDMTVTMSFLPFKC
ncbi:NHLP-related RiPP peptide [Coralloluteibacterium thermophilus]|uniref:NHLP-related RiPP peptide n=1 Tax=Coralloluteibacterium thermophilum TaxID=2707049 RepID=A0ABV9NKY1_9GAMM